jgi:putative DNA primase/helicase
MDFIDFARSHGIIINDLPPIGQWKRYPTEDHPRKKNGACKYMGTHGFVQNHATSTVVSLWKPDSINESQRRDYSRMAAQAEQEKVRMQEKAAIKAKKLLNGSVLATHPYLKSKGFPEEQGWVNDKKLIIPMRINGELVGCQVVDADGGKKFLFGQKTANASFDFDNKGKHYLCEGYATGLAIREAVQALRMPYVIHVTFSAQNMLKVSRIVPAGVVVADNDVSKTGERVAQQIGWPYWMSEVEGEDAHDAWRRVGTFRLSQALRSVLMNGAKKRADLNVVGG